MGWSDRGESGAFGRIAGFGAFSATGLVAAAGASAGYPTLEPMTPTGIALAIAFLVISLGVHEAAHAWMALKCGDTTARDLGRLTLNPVAHIDPVMTIILPALLFMTGGFIFGGAKPVPVAYHRLRNPLRDMALVALAGPVSNFIQAVVFMLAFKAAQAAGYESGATMFAVLKACVVFNLVLAVFNMMPVPPLDGSRVMAWLLPSSIRDAYVGLERIGMILVILLVFWFPPFRMMLWTGIDGLWSLVDLLTGGTWS